jgi:hypothetical protein
MKTYKLIKFNWNASRKTTGILDSGSADLNASIKLFKKYLITDKFFLDSMLKINGELFVYEVNNKSHYFQISFDDRDLTGQPKLRILN